MLAVTVIITAMIGQDSKVYSLALFCEGSYKYYQTRAMGSDTHAQGIVRKPVYRTAGISSNEN